MKTYKLIANSEYVWMIVGESISCVPNDSANRDWQEYQNWLSEGNIPDPADEE